MKKILLIIVFLTSGTCYGQIAIVDTTFGNRQVVGRIHKILIDFDDSTYQVEITHETIVDSISMGTSRFNPKGDWKGVQWLPLNATQITRIKKTCKDLVNWRKGILKPKSK